MPGSVCARPQCGLGKRKALVFTGPGFPEEEAAELRKLLLEFLPPAGDPCYQARRAAVGWCSVGGWAGAAAAQPRYTRQ